MLKIEKTDYPRNSLFLPYSEKTVVFRPWNMKEHKILVMAFEQKDQLESQRAMLQILQNIVLDGTNVGKLPSIEFDLLFLRARSISVGSKIEINIENKETKKVRPVGIDLDKVEALKDPNRNYTIELGSYILQMRELNAESRMEVLELKTRNPETAEEVELALRCVDRVSNAGGDSVSASDVMGELRDLLENLKPMDYEKINEFVEGIPIIRYDLDVSKVFPNGSGILPLEGIDSFFA